MKVKILYQRYSPLFASFGIYAPLLYVRVYTVSIIIINPIKPKPCFIEKLYKNSRKLSRDYSVNLEWNSELRVEIPFSFPDIMETRKISGKCNLLCFCVRFDAFSGCAQSRVLHTDPIIFLAIFRDNHPPITKPPAHGLLYDWNSPNDRTPKQI